MIRHIFKQLWNKRRSNGWILLELILVTFFMWSVIDPVYVLLSNRAIDPGYDISNTFQLSLGEYHSTHSKYRKEFDSDSARKKSMLYIHSLVKDYPGIESSVITYNTQYPMSSSMSSSMFKHDSIDASALIMGFYADGAFFEVFGIKNVNTGMIPRHDSIPRNSVYITGSMANKLFPEGNYLGKEIYNPYDQDSTKLTVAGVVSDFKFHSTEQPRQTIFIPSDKLNANGFPYAAQICFRIRDGISKQRFAEHLKQELAPRLSAGNLYFLRLTDFETIRTNSELEQGITNTLRLQISLAVFFLICTFLGIAGTFWLRSDARKAEIGLRMAMGRSRKNILKEFLTEAWLLTTIAWLIGVIIVLQKVIVTGFAEAPQFENEAYIQNLFVPHYLIVSGIVYVLILVIALVGTWIPAHSTASIEPAEALREE